ncbi:MAG: hypothetical protein LBM98_03775, partial [Oscillospiraceae bacterium]|nr:hypothetical protein [Oscillospiraceae bacterium]
FWTWERTPSATYVQTPVIIHYSLFIINCPTPIPSVEGCRPQAAGWFPAPCATYPRNPRPNPRL